MRSLREIMGDQKFEKLAEWRETHHARGCAETAVGGRCRCECPDHRCNEAVAPDEALVAACAMCHGDRLVRDPSLRPGDPGFGRAQPCPRCLTDEEAVAERVARNAPSLLTYGPADLGDVAPLERQVWLGAWVAAFDPPILTLWGMTGSGKTFAALAVAREAAKERRVEMLSAVELLDELRATFKPNAEQDIDDVLRRLKSVGLLVIDDLGAENDTKFTSERVLDVVDSRLRRRLPTVVTTNLKPDDVPGVRLKSRLFSTQDAMPLNFGGDDRRMG